MLRELAEFDRNLEAPASVEIRLRAALRERYRHRKWPYVAIAAALVLVIGLRPKVQTMEIAVAAPSVPVLPIVKPAVHRQQPKEVTTEFFALMEDPPPFERGELLRVSVPASAMRSVGLPVSEEHLDDVVQADVLVGEEGLARAIRFVNRL
jgi:hypothetical protein